MPKEENNAVYKPKSMILKNIPKDIYEILLIEQAREKIKCCCQVKLEYMVFDLIRKYKTLSETKNK